MKTQMLQMLVVMITRGALSDAGYFEVRTFHHRWRLLLARGEMHCGLPHCSKSTAVTSDAYLSKWAEQVQETWRVLHGLQT